MKSMNYLRAGTFALAFAATACDTKALLEVEDPDVVLPIALKDTTNLSVVRGFGIGEFGVAFGGASTTYGLVAMTGITSDEMFHSGTFLPNKELDKREISSQNTTVTTVFRALHRARRATELAAETWEGARGSTREVAELQALNAYTYLYFAENWCSGVPVSLDTEGVFTFGQPLTTAQLLDEAANRFETAQTTAAAASADSIRFLGLMGEARVLLNRGDYAAAAALVTGIPTSWRYAIAYSANTTRQNNGIFGITQTRREYAIASNEGLNGVNFRTTPVDPRVPWTRDLSGEDSSLRQYTPRKFDSRAAPIDVASGIEARLIEAEAALARGASGSYVAILNTLRGRLALPGITDPVTPAARVDQFFRERAFWLWGQGQRLSDMRRLVRQYGRLQQNVFPSGAYVREGMDGNPRTEAVPYGADVTIPVPFDETNNRNFTQCLDRNA
jgi:hypothetical protein